MSVDNLSQDFLGVLVAQDGEATTTDIRSETGMSRGQVNHRFKKLENKNWIDIERADSGRGDREPPKLAILTEEGEKSIKNGDAGKRVLQDNTDDKNEIKVSKNQIQEFYTEIDKINSRLNTIADNVNMSEDKDTGRIAEERIDNIESDLSRLERTVEMLNDTIVKGDNKSKYNTDKDDENEKESNIDKEVINNLRDEQDYLKEWMDVAQKHMIAFRIYVQDEGDSFEHYLDMAEQRISSDE